jgi:hypothetical protein
MQAQAPRIPTCQDTDTTEPGQQPYTCPSYAVPNPSPQPGLPSDANCCLNRTCANTDPAGNSSTPVPQTCPPNYIINVNMSDVSPPNASVCCMPRISCIDTNPNRDGCQPFFCDPALGYIVNQNASYLPNPSNNVCCLVRGFCGRGSADRLQICLLLLVRCVPLLSVCTSVKSTWKSHAAVQSDAACRKFHCCCRQLPNAADACC